MSFESDCLTRAGKVKRRYESRARAERVARQTGKKRLADGPNHAYLCPDCKQFHVGHVE
jgi:hypothetical protein